MIGFAAAGMEMADMAWEVKCREEDMKQRALENERHAIDDARRSVDEKAEQLKVLANQSALFAGFSMVVLVESNIPDGIDGILLTIFGGTTACVIALMLVSSLNATYMLVAILRYDCVNRDVPFDAFWRKRCEPDWKLALRAFSLGVPLFMVVVALVAWVTFWDSDSLIISASVVTAIALMVTIFWFGSTHRKWTGFLMMNEARVLTRGMSFAGSPSSRHSIQSTTRNAEQKDKRSEDGSQDEEHSIAGDSLNISSLAIGDLTASEKKMTIPKR
mmetsp:Transcript_16479/g.39453  ORF Transcript_16479/g.39453 Transcript_16479/m.39453 type:complete len:274 (+) Transcript_16479:141-962(+)